VLKPKNSLEVKSAVIAAVIVLNNINGEKLLCTSSKENITPAKGALKAAASPALAPLVIRYLSSL